MLIPMKSIGSWGLPLNIVGSKHSLNGLRCVNAIIHCKKMRHQCTNLPSGKAIAERNYCCWHPQWSQGSLIWRSMCSQCDSVYLYTQSLQCIWWYDLVYYIYIMVIRRIPICMAGPNCRVPSKCGCHICVCIQPRSDCDEYRLWRV